MDLLKIEGLCSIIILFQHCVSPLWSQVNISTRAVTWVTPGSAHLTETAQPGVSHLESVEAGPGTGAVEPASGRHQPTPVVNTNIGTWATTVRIIQLLIFIILFYNYTVLSSKTIFSRHCLLMLTVSLFYLLLFKRSNRIINCFSKNLRSHELSQINSDYILDTPKMMIKDF